MVVWSKSIFRGFESCRVWLYPDINWTSQSWNLTITSTSRYAWQKHMYVWMSSYRGCLKMWNVWNLNVSWHHIATFKELSCFLYNLEDTISGLEVLLRTGFIIISLSFGVVHYEFIHIFLILNKCFKTFDSYFSILMVRSRS